MYLCHYRDKFYLFPYVLNMCEKSAVLGNAKSESTCMISVLNFISLRQKYCKEVSKRSCDCLHDVGHSLRCIAIRPSTLLVDICIVLFGFFFKTLIHSEKDW